MRGSKSREEMAGGVRAASMEDSPHMLSEGVSEMGEKLGNGLS